MDFEEFEKVIKKLDRNKYHVGRTLSFNKNGPYISEWDIFRKDMTTEEYFSPENLAILSSRYNNTIEDIEELIAKKNRIQKKHWYAFFSDIIKDIRRYNILYKRVIGFENKEKNIKNDDVCPICSHRTLRLPIGVETNEGFLGLRHKRYTEYICDKCGCIWRA